MNKYEIEINISLDNFFYVESENEDDAKTEAMFELVEQIKEMRTSELLSYMTVTVKTR